MDVSSLPEVGAKNGIFRVHTVKNDRNRHENDVYCGPSLCFVSHVCTESAIFAPATGRQLCMAFSGEKLLKYSINMVLYSR